MSEWMVEAFIVTKLMAIIIGKGSSPGRNEATFWKTNAQLIFDQTTVGQAETSSETFRCLELVVTTVWQSSEWKCAQWLETKITVRRISPNSNSSGKKWTTPVRFKKKMWQRKAVVSQSEKHPPQLFFSAADKCGGNVRISTANYLTSPGYPMSYPPSQRCTWVISAPGPHQRILINFNPHFDLEDRECK